jgi:hypothetical protein
LTGLKTVSKLLTDVLNVCNPHLIESDQIEMNLTISKSKMKPLSQITCAVSIAINSIAAVAFDINTHAAMTAKAVEQSKITSSPNTSNVLKKLGLYDKDFAIGSSYIDIGSLIKRDTTGFEQKVIDDVGATQKTGLTLPASHTIPGWIIRGTIREDDNTIETAQGNSTGSGDEPGGVFNRVYGHFYDPVVNRGLTLGLEVGAKSVDWATDKSVTANGRKNYYNVPAAREAMWRALTLKEILPNGTLAQITPIGGLVSYAADEAERKAYWATMFRAVGDVVHLLQDAAQPQHTRNDTHSGLGCVPGTGACVIGHASFFEYYLAARTLRATQFRLPEGFASAPPNSGALVQTNAAQLDYCCYTPPTFTKYSDYFATGTGAANANGKGLANYSNRGFFSFGTNIGSFNRLNYPLPDPNVLTDTVISGTALVGMTGAVVGDGTATMKFKQGMVIDSISGNVESNVKLSAYGAFDQFLIEKSLLPQYTLNYYNYDDQARLLIPRAVGYSAGLIDYFFRGELEIGLPDEGVYALVDYSQQSTKDIGGFNKVKLKLTNKTPSISPSGGGTTVEQNLMPSGTVVAVAKFRRNKCYIENTLQGEVQAMKVNGRTDQDIFDNCRDVTEEIVVSDPVVLPGVLTNGSTVPLTFNFTNPNRIPINVMDLYLQLVYRGPLGDEADAVVVGTRDVSEPTFFTISNNTNYQQNFAPGAQDCEFVKRNAVEGGPATKVDFKISLKNDLTTPIISTQLLDNQYAMFAAISEGPIRLKASAQFVNSLKQITPLDLTVASTPLPDSYFSAMEQQFVMTDGSLYVVNTPSYRVSQFNQTAAQTIRLDLQPAPIFDKVRGVYIDSGFATAFHDFDSLCLPPQATGYTSVTRYFSRYPGYSPMVPKQLDSVLNF